MAEWLDPNKDKPSSVAPAGLRQQQGQGGFQQLDQGSASPWMQPKWQTGGRVGSTQNAFNDDFYDRMYKQYDEERQKLDKNPNQVSSLFLRDDFTGIVGWNQDIKKDNGVLTTDRDRSFRVGDVYDNGKRLGNVYDQDSGFTLEEANAFVAPHIFGKTAADKFKEANGDQEKLKSLILDQGQKTGEDVSGFMTRLPYVRRQEELLKEWDQGVGDEIALGAAAFAGGAAVGSFAGLPGALVGGVLNTVGTLLNKDEALAQAASAIASAEIVGRDKGAAAGGARAVEAWSQFGAQRLNVFSNLVGGVVDASAGVVGDGKSTLRESAYRGDVGANIALGVTGFADGLLTAASPVARGAYMTTMGGNVGGKAFNQAFSGGEFDEVTGAFHQYDSWAQQLSGAGSTAIDLGQMFLPAVLRKSAAVGRGGSGLDNAFDAARTPGAARDVTILDRTFTVENRGGNLYATAERKADLAMAAVAPSVLVNRLGTRLQALGTSAKAGGTRVDANALYQAAVKIEQAPVPFKLMLVNGFGESSEEVVQTFLNAQATGQVAEPTEYLQAAIAGFAMGAGMSIGARVGTVTDTSRMLYRANALAVADGRDIFDRKTFAALPKEEQLRLSTPRKSVEQQIQKQVKQTTADWKREIVRSSEALLEAQDAAMQVNAGRQRVSSSENGSLQGMFGANRFNSIKMRSDSVYMSAQTLYETMQNRSTALLEMLQKPSDSDQPYLDRAREAQASLQTLIDTEVKPQVEAMAAGSPDALDALNNTLQAWWHGTSEQQRAVGLAWSRSPNDNPGSFQLLLPQVDVDFTQRGIHQEIKFSQALSKALSSDYDGDRLKHEARAFYDDSAFNNLKMGVNLWNGGTHTKKQSQASQLGYLDVADRAAETDIMREVGFALIGKDKIENAHARRAIEDIVDLLKEALPGVRKNTFTTYKNDLLSNPASAKETLYKNLSKDLNVLLVLGQNGNKGHFANGTNIGLWIEDTLQTHWNMYREALATRVRVEVYNPSQYGTPPPNVSWSYTNGVRPMNAATPGQTVQYRTGGDDNFRNMGKLQYHPGNSRIEDAADYVNPDQLVQMYTDWYTTMSRFRAGTQIEEVLYGADKAVRDAYSDLVQTAQMFVPDLYNQDPTGTLLWVSAQPFYAVTENDLANGKFNDKDSLTVGQLLLRNASARNAAELPLQPGQIDPTFQYHSLNPGEATLALLRGTAIADLVSPDSAEYLGQYGTLGTLVEDYLATGDPIARAQMRDSWALNPEYKINDGRGMTAFSPDAKPSNYRIVIDTVRQAVDSNLAHDLKAPGKVSGKYHEMDVKFHNETVLAMRESMHKIGVELGLTKDTSRQEVLDHLSASSSTFHYMMQLLTPEMRLRIILPPDNPTRPDEVVLPSWVFDLLLEPDNERAVMMYWNGLFDLELQSWQSRIKDGEESTATPQNRWIDLYESLSVGDRAEFNSLRSVSTSLEAFTELVNARFANDRVPMLMWRTDTSLFDPSVSRGGWQWSSPSAELRTSIEGANKYFQRKARTIRGDFTASAANMDFAKRMLDQMRSPNPNDRRRGERLSRALTIRLQQAQNFSNAALGPSGARALVQTTIRGIDSSSASKGSPGPGTSQLGGTMVRREQTAYDSQLGQVVGAIAAVDASDVAFNPQMLTRPWRIQTASGKMIDWDMSDPEKYLEFFLADDGAYQGLLWDLINPMIWEENVQGTVSYHNLLPKNLEEIVNSTLHADLLTGSGSVEADELDALTISYLNSVTSDNEVYRLMSHVGIARTSASRKAKEEFGAGDYGRLQREIAGLLRDMSGLSTESLYQVRDRLKVSLFAKYLAGQGRVEDANALLERSEGQPARLQILLKSYSADEKIARDAYFQDQSDLTLSEWMNALKLKAETAALLEENSIFAVLHAGYKIDWSSDTASLTQLFLGRYIDENFNNLYTTSNGVDREVLDSYQRAPLDQAGVVKYFGPDANQETWDVLSRIVAFHNTEQMSGIRSSSRVATPDTSNMDLFDPTYSYLVDRLISEQTITAVHLLRDSVGERKPLPLSVEKLEDRINRTILEPALLGPWTPQLVVAHLGADRSFDAASSAEQINIGGQDPKLHEATDNAARRTFEYPSPDMARAFDFDPDEFLKSSESLYQPGLNGDPWALLEGAFVPVPLNRDDKTGPTLRVFDDNGNVTAEYPLFLRTNQYNALPFKRPKGATHAIVRTDVDALRTAVQVAYRKARAEAPSGSTFSVEFSMFHPADKPADPQWANNVYFDGTVDESDSAQSLYSAWSTLHNGRVQMEQRQALDSIKGKKAIFTQKQRRRLDDKPVENLAEVINLMAIELLTTQMGPEYFFTPNLYRSAYRMARDLLVVVDAGQVYSTEQVLTGAVQLTPDAKVVELSRRTRETLHGSKSGSGHPTLLNRAPKIGGEGAVWTGVYDPSLLALVPELGQTATNVTDVGDSLRASGLTSNERSTTYSYKMYTNEGVLRQGFPFARFDESRNTVKTARVKVEARDRIREQTLRTFSTLEASLGIMRNADEAVGDTLIDTLGGVGRDRIVQEATDIRTANDLLSYLNGNHARIWRFDTERGSRVEGVLRNLLLVEGDTPEHIAPVDDVLWLQLENIFGDPNSKQWQSRVHEIISQAQDLGMPIILTHKTDIEARSEAEAILLRAGSNYQRNGVAQWLFTPSSPSDSFQTISALDNQLKESRVTSLENVAIFALSNDGAYETDDEAVTFDPKSDSNSAGFAISQNILPTSGLHGYSPLLTPQAAARAQTMLEKLTEPDGLRYLAEQTIRGEGREPGAEEVAVLTTELKPFVEKALRTLDPNTGIFRTNNETFDVGDMIVVFNKDGKLALIRWGYELPDRDFLEVQGQYTMDGLQVPGLEQTGALRVSTTKRVPQQIGSVSGGVPTRLARTHPYGLRAVFRQPVSMIASKMVDGEGKKFRAGVIDKDLAPSKGIFRSVFVNFFDSMIGRIKKGARLGIVDNAQQGIFFYGWDATRALFNVLPMDFQGKTNFSIDEWYGLGPEGRQSIMGEVASHLQAYQQQLPIGERITRGADLKDAINSDTEANQNAVAYVSQIHDQLGLQAAMALQDAGNVPLDQAEVQYLALAYQYLRGDGTRVEDLLGAPGFGQERSAEQMYSREIPSIIADFIDSNALLRKYIVDDINSRVESVGDSVLEEGWRVNEDWSAYYRNPDGKTRRVTFQTVRAFATGEDDSTKDMQLAQNATADYASNQQQMISSSSILGLNLGYDTRNEHLDTILRTRSLDNLAGIVKTSNVTREEDVASRKSLRAIEHEIKALYKAKGYVQPFARTGWDIQSAPVQKLRETYTRISNTLGLTDDGRYDTIIDSMIRGYYRANHDTSVSEADDLSVQSVQEGADQILQHLLKNEWWFAYGRLGAEHYDVVRLIEQYGTWVPDGLDVSQGRTGRLVKDAFETMFSNNVLLPADAQLEVDGMMLTYRPMIREAYFLSTTRPEVLANLMDLNTGAWLSTIDQRQQRLLDNGDVFYNRTENSLDQTGGINDSLSPISRTPLAVRTEMGYRRQQDAKRGENGNIERLTTRELREQGRKNLSQVQFTTRFWHSLQSIRTIVPQMNPMLWIYNPVDSTARYIPERILGFLTGTSSGYMGRASREMISRLAEFKTDSDFANAVRSAFGVEETFLKPEDNVLFRDAVNTLKQNSEWRNKIAAERKPNITDEMELGRINKALRSGADLASRLQDSTHGIPPRAQAELYIRGILEYERQNGTRTAAQVLDKIATDPLYYLYYGDRAAHNLGSQKIAAMKAADQTAFGVFVNGVINPMAASDRAPINFIGNTLQLFMKFRGFAFNSTRFLTGSYGFDAVAAILLQGNYGGSRARFKGLTNLMRSPEFRADFISETMSSVDVADAFIKSGISHSGLFMAALAFSASGLLGEDEEERKRRKAEQLQGLGRLYDPRDVANDWRNRDALYLDFLNDIGLGLLAAPFTVPTADGQPTRSPVNLHWALNFFVAPVRGIAEFLQSGDYSDILRGFSSAVGDMPLINTNFFWEGAMTGQMMYEAAANGTNEDPGEIAKAGSFLLKAVMTLEKSLFELSFINELYTTLDEYTRDPFKLPDMQEDGTIRRDRLGVPLQTEAEQPFLNPETGLWETRKTSRNYDEGLLRSYATNNATFALFATMFTGFQFNQPGSFLRNDMAVKTQTIVKDSLSNDEAEALVLSVWDPTNRREVLTRDGQEALIRSLHAGSLKPTDPAMRGVFMTGDQRAAVGESLQKKIFAEGVEVLGLSPEKAEARMWEIWNGPSYAPGIQGLGDVVWSNGDFSGENGISWNETVQYRQLNTTWVTGPDGRPWATGLSRGQLAEFFSPLKGYQGAAGLTFLSNLKVDELLNSVDEYSGVNTGMRNLTRVDESLKIPSTEDVLDMMKESTDRVIDEIRDLSSDLNRNLKSYGGSGYNYGGGYGRSYGSGGSGGGYSKDNPFLPFLNAFRYGSSDNVPQIYINNTNPRRADIRRERFTSERGRLNPWQ